MRCTWLLLLVLLLSGCYSTTPSKSGDKAEQAQAIQSITLYQNPPSIAPKYQYYHELVIRRNLSTHYLRKDYEKEIVQHKDGKISQTEFDALLELLKQANFTKLSSRHNMGPIPIGDGSHVLAITTPKKIYEYTSSSTEILPTDLMPLLDKMRGYLPAKDSE